MRLGIITSCTKIFLKELKKSRKIIKWFKNLRNDLAVDWQSFLAKN